MFLKSQCCLLHFKLHHQNLVAAAGDERRQVDEIETGSAAVPAASSDPTDHTMQYINNGRKVLATPAVRRLAMEHKARNRFVFKRKIDM